MFCQYCGRLSPCRCHGNMFGDAVIGSHQSSVAPRISFQFHVKVENELKLKHEATFILKQEQRRQSDDVTSCSVNNIYVSLSQKKFVELQVSLCVSLSPRLSLSHES